MARILSNLIKFSLLFILSGTVLAQEQWCTDNPSICVSSETFQATSYTTQNSGPNWWCGSSGSTKPGSVNNAGGCGNPAAISCLDGSCNGTFASTFQISTDSSVLSLLPNRNTSSVSRFIRANDNFGGAVDFGSIGISLGSTIKRIAFRWYSYHSPTYDWAGDNGGACTNGKIGHISTSAWGTGPFLTLTNGNSGQTALYSFLAPGWGWTWTGHASFEGFNSNGPPGPDSSWAPSNQRGKWYRHEIVVRRPRTADSNGGGLGFDFSYFVKNVTDNTAELEVMRLSSGCTNCMVSGGPNFTWNTGTYPSSDITSIHTEFYRAGTCRGWQGWLYAASAKWTTDTGTERIGAASEVEGGSSPDTLHRLVMYTTGLALLGIGVIFTGIFFYVKTFHKPSGSSPAYRRNSSIA